jgi:hypothetical protein
MSHVRTAWPALVAAALAAPASAQEVEPVRITLHPGAAVTPALRYHLLPQLHEMTPGNAAERYRQAIAEMKKDRPAGPDDSELADVQDWLELPPAELPRARVRKLMRRYAEVYRLADQAARSESCDWGIAERLRKSGIGALIPEIQDMRALARLLALRARVEALDGRAEQAVRALQTGFAAAKHVGESDTLIGTLVGVANATLTARELELLLSQPTAPSLYWPLADLPRPFLDMRRALTGERTGVYGTFPGLIEVVNNPDAPPLTGEQLKPAVNLLIQELNLGDGYPVRAAVALWVRAKHHAAQESLAAAGYPRARLEKMPHLEVALLHAMQQYDRLYDEMLKWQTFPYPEAMRGMERAERRVVEARARMLSPGPDVPALPIAPWFLPAIRRAWSAHARIDRRFAALRCVEAVRLYAVAHGGRLPPTLADVKEAPAPNDPCTGKPFAYRVVNGVATLEGPPPPGEAANVGNALKYELIVEK